MRKDTVSFYSPSAIYLSPHCLPLPSHLLLSSSNMKSIIITTLVLLYNITECRSFSSPRRTVTHLNYSSSIISSSLMTPIHQLLHSSHSPGLSLKLSISPSSSKPSIQLQSYQGSRYISRSSMALQMSLSEDESVSSSSPEASSSINTIDQLLSKLTSFFPLFVLGSAILGSYFPKTLNWVNNGSYITIMLSA